MHEHEQPCEIVVPVLSDGHRQGAVLTLPLSAGWAAIEAAMNAAIERLGGASWLYGNVYDAIDGVTPLGWWDHEG